MYEVLSLQRIYQCQTRHVPMWPLRWVWSLVRFGSLPEFVYESLRHELSEYPRTVLVIVLRELYQHLRSPPLRDPVCHNLVNQQKGILEDHGVLRVGKYISEVSETRE